MTWFFCVECEFLGSKKSAIRVCFLTFENMLHVKMSGGQQEISCTESCESSAAAEVTNSYVSINL